MIPRFSVVIDNYNYGRFLAQAIEGVLSQNYSGGVECIVVDDGSTDESREVLAGYGDRIRAVLQPNQGQAAAFNAGFDAARGEFVCLLDSDDYWKPNKLAVVEAAFVDPGVGVVQHFLREVDVNGVDLPQRFPRWPSRYEISDVLDRRTELTATSGLTFRRSVLDKIRPIPRDVFYYLDDMLVVKALLLSSVVNIPEVLGFHRVHNKNFCAGGYQDPRKLELDKRMRAIFNREIDPLLSSRGLIYTRRARRESDLEDLRRDILLFSHTGDRRRAARTWFKMVFHFGWTWRGFFRVATCSLALISLGLYLRAYEAYKNRP